MTTTDVADVQLRRRDRKVIATLLVATFVVILNETIMGVALPVLMVSASVQAHHRARARQVGVAVFIPKPFEPSAVVEVVERLAGVARRGP